MNEDCDQCKDYEDEIFDLKSEITSFESENGELEVHVTKLEKALDDVMGEINAAREDLSDAEEIIGRNT